MFRFKAVIASAFLVLFAAQGASTAQDTSAGTPPDAQKEQAMEGMRFMLRRAEFVRLLAAQHLQYLNANREKAAFHMLEEASQVMAYNLICEDDTMQARELNNIAAQVTLQVAVLMDQSPAAKTMADAMQQMTPTGRMILVGDISSAVLMFKIGRRRGLFDALLTDFGSKRFCSGMRTDMRRRYNGLVANLPDE